MCENRDSAAGDGFTRTEGPEVIVWGKARSGIKNARRLLPLAKRLTLEALRETGAGPDVLKRRAAPGTRTVNRVRRVVLDRRLGGAAAVCDERPGEIRIGPNYAMDLTSDDEALFLLAHELTHVAAWSGQLRGFADVLAQRAGLTAAVALNDEQKEDLACEFIAMAVFKRFVELEPAEESKEKRLARVLGYESPSDRLQFAWDDFCFSYYGEHSYSGDVEHLSQGEVRRALRELDPELGALIPADPSPPPP